MTGVGGVCEICITMCLGCGGIVGQSVGGLDQGLDGWGGVMYV